MRRKRLILDALILFAGTVCGYAIGIYFLMDDTAFSFRQLDTTNFKSLKYLQEAVDRLTPHEAKKLNRDKEEEITRWLHNEIRVLCFVVTHPNNHKTNANAVKRTWGRHCNTLIFISEEEDLELPTVKVNAAKGRNGLWAKTVEAFKYVHKHYRDEYDWVLKADDDTFVILEHLRSMLMTFTPDDPIYFGCHLQPVAISYMSGGAGYVLSKAAVELFITKGVGSKDSKCKAVENTGNEDVNLGICLEELGVKFGDSRDVEGRHRFFPETVETYVEFNPNTSDRWVREYSYWPLSTGVENWSRTPITFHHLTTDLMYKLEYLVYNVSVFSVRHLVRYESFTRPLLLQLRYFAKMHAEKNNIDVVLL